MDLIAVIRDPGGGGHAAAKPKAKKQSALPPVSGVGWEDAEVEAARRARAPAGDAPEVDDAVALPRPMTGVTHMQGWEVMVGWADVLARYPAPGERPPPAAPAAPMVEEAPIEEEREEEEPPPAPRASAARSSAPSPWRPAAPVDEPSPSPWRPAARAEEAAPSPWRPAVTVDEPAFTEADDDALTTTSRRLADGLPPDTLKRVAVLMERRELRKSAAILKLWLKANPDDATARRMLDLCTRPTGRARPQAAPTASLPEPNPQAIPVVNMEALMGATGFTPTDAYILSRIDGHTTIHSLRMVVPELSRDGLTALLVRSWKAGVLHFKAPRR